MSEQKFRHQRQVKLRNQNKEGTNQTEQVPKDMYKSTISRPALNEEGTLKPATVSEQWCASDTLRSGGRSMGGLGTGSALQPWVCKRYSAQVMHQKQDLDTRNRERR